MFIDMAFQKGENHPKYWLGKKFSEEHKRKMRKSHPNFSGRNHPIWGKHHSEEIKRKMSEAHKGLCIGEKSSSWNGGKYKSEGYIFIYKPKHPFATKSGYVREHRLIAEKYLKRYLTKLEVIHHINEIRDDNKLENLYLFDIIGKHLGYHKLKNKPLLVSNIISS